jgi:hypothetical protein
MQQLHVEPDLAIPFPEDNPVLANFRERAEAACRTAELLELDTTPDEEDMAVAETIAYEVAKNEDKVNTKITTKKASTIKPATYYAVNDILKEFSTKVVDNALQIRLLVTNKLLLESVNEDAKIRIRALELLGKITDVGLFTEKSEVTINHRSNQELVDSLRSKIHKLMNPQGVEDVKAVEVNGETIDVDKEMGLEGEEEPAQDAQDAQIAQENQNTPGETTKNDDNSDSKPA